jgi:hypothetical protein
MAMVTKMSRFAGRWQPLSRATLLPVQDALPHVQVRGIARRESGRVLAPHWSSPTIASAPYPC